jgi:hypothetical protein
MDDSSLVVIHAFNNTQEAELAAGALDAAGIDAMIQADSGGGMRPHLAWAGVGYQILVREEDAAAAREILDLPAQPVA